MYYIVNLSQIPKTKQRYVSPLLSEKIEATLKKWEKVILYLNKRGLFSSLICKDCQTIYKCKNCDTSLTVHKKPPILLCHICWYKEEIPLYCKSCRWNNLEKIGFWTQQIEEQIETLYPNVKIYRFDHDSTKNKTWKKDANILLDNADIIIGTKMITTGFDFDNVWLIWVLLLEQELSVPEYNIEEKVYQNIKQLMGRWWRKWKECEIVVQTFIPENESIKNITEKNYNEFIKDTLSERKLFWYPPLKELIRLEYRDENKEKAMLFLKKIQNILDLENTKLWMRFEIIFSDIPRLKHNKYHYILIIKWDNIRDFLLCIKKEIFWNRNLSILFD